MESRFFVITGGPGAGKTSLLEELGNRGYPTMDEGGRALIRTQRLIDGPALPSSDPTLFGDLLVSWHIRSFETARRLSGRVFFDRGLPDVFGFYAFHGLSAPDYAHRAARIYRYAAPVFFAPPWAAIYHSDAERRETYEEAVEVFEHTLGAYVSLGYIPMILPLGTVAERVRFVLDVLDDYADPRAT